MGTLRVAYPYKIYEEYYLLYFYDYNCQGDSKGSTDMITTCVCEDENVNELNLKTPSTLENDTFSNFTIKSFNETFNIPEIDCSNPKTSHLCSNFTCQIYNLAEQHSVNLVARFRIWKP